MIYYKVKPQYDNLRIYNKKGKYTGFLIANELYTAKEREKLNISDHVFELLEVPKRAIYWFFGARFCA